MREKQSKMTEVKHERLLNELLKVPGNDRCADCAAKNPRWASYSLGVFLCIRCASLHRKMGTHVSKIKSISVDRWTMEEIKFMQNWGNEAVNRQVVTNASKNPFPVTLDDDHKMEKYLREKWEKKLFQEATAAEEQFYNTPTPSISSTTNSSVLASPVSSSLQLAGRVGSSNNLVKDHPVTATVFATSPIATNPFLVMNKQQQQSFYNPFAVTGLPVSSIQTSTEQQAFFHHHNNPATTTIAAPSSVTNPFLNSAPMPTKNSNNPFYQQQSRLESYFYTL